MRGVICVFFRKVSQIGKKGEKTEKIGVNLRKTCGNFDEAVGKVDETMKTSGNLDEVVKVCRKCLNFYEGLTCSGSVVPVVSRCCALNDDGCGVGCEEVFVVAQSSFLDDSTVDRAIIEEAGLCNNKYFLTPHTASVIIQCATTGYYGYN